MSLKSWSLLFLQSKEVSFVGFETVFFPPQFQGNMFSSIVA